VAGEGGGVEIGAAARRALVGRAEISFVRGVRVAFRFGANPHTYGFSGENLIQTERFTGPDKCRGNAKPVFNGYIIQFWAFYMLC
jgi:hypothetical protein